MVRGSSVKSLSNVFGNRLKRHEFANLFYDEGMSKAKILVIDDELHIREMISDALSLAGHSTELAPDGFEALKMLRAGRYDLVVTDVNMPKMDGFALIDYMRKHGDDTPVICLTARNQKPDVSIGFKLGADDYITKPFGLEELTLRVAAVLRRTFVNDESQKVLRCGPVLVDEQAHKVLLNEREIELSPTEFRLLVYLIENKNHVLTKYALLERIWGIDFTDSTTVVDTYISYLRKKIHTDTYKGIHTVRGIGFQMVED